MKKRGQDKFLLRVKTTSEADKSQLSKETTLKEIKPID